jgi:two-component system alkaline phosphatase synthesis response regulator PhoP
MDVRILLAEDEEHLLEAIKLNLEMEGYEVVTAKDGNEAIKKFEKQRFNLAILDVMMPEMNGTEVCQHIRITDMEIPILFLTAKDSSQDKVLGLKVGADDYITKPFNLEELLLRVRVLVKHSHKGTKQEQDLKTYKFGSNTVNFVTYEAKGYDGVMHHLTKKEVMLLKLLIDRKDEVVSRNDILQHVWGYDVYPSTRTIDNFILAFRRYFEPDPKEPKYFQSIRSVGYKFECN